MVVALCFVCRTRGVHNDANTQRV